MYNLCTVAVFLENSAYLCIIRYVCLNDEKYRKIEGLNMISANNVTYRVGKKALFEDVNIKLK